jgi:hypothetical protein
MSRRAMPAERAAPARGINRKIQEPAVMAASLAMAVGCR